MEVVPYELLLIGLYLLTGLLALHNYYIMSVLQFYMTSNLSVQLTTGVPTPFAATAPEND